MKLNKLMIAAMGVAGLVFASCESEFRNDVNLDVNVAAEEGVSFDGQTITVKAGTPVNFQLSGDPDFLTFFSGEAGHEYRYRDRITVDSEDIESARLQFTVNPQYGCGRATVYVSDSFTGLLGSGSTSRNLFMQDSVLVESTDWQPLAEIIFSNTTNPDAGTYLEDANCHGATDFDIDLASYLGERIAFAIYYEGGKEGQTQSRFAFQNLEIVNTMTSGQQTSLTASSFGFTALNMMYANPEFLSTGGSGSRQTYAGNRPYGTATNNTSGVWNVSDWTNFFIHSSSTGPLVHSWLVSNLMVVNACTPDSGTALKNITESLNTYSYTYTEPGTYTATFYAVNSNNVTESNMTREYTVVVTE